MITNIVWILLCIFFLGIVGCRKEEPANPAEPSPSPADVAPSGPVMPALGASAPVFRLPDPEGRLVGLDDFPDGRAYVVVFLSNHCPYVKHIRNGLANLVKEYQAKGNVVIGINSNDAQTVPEDSPAQMAVFAREAGFTFPYLVDETQETAKAYRAVCTPDFFLFDRQKKLVYRGQMDDSRPNSQQPVTGADLRAALDALLKGEPVAAVQKPSVGCSIKWKPGNAPRP